MGSGHQYPLPTTVRVSRLTNASLHGLVDEASAEDLLGEVFDELAEYPSNARISGERTDAGHASSCPQIPDPRTA